MYSISKTNFKNITFLLTFSARFLILHLLTKNLISLNPK